MKFTIPCFVRVEDAGKRRRLLIWLQEIGYDLYQSARSLNYPILCCNMIDDEPGNVYGEYAEELTGLCGTYTYDCGENIELLKALAAINDENDLNQWYVCDVPYWCDLRQGDWVIKRDTMDHTTFFSSVFHKATAEEIVEHFKEK